MIDDNEYWRIEGGKSFTIPNMDKLCHLLKTKFADLQVRINDILLENKHLKEEHYKDEEINSLRKELEEYKKNSIYILPEDKQLADNWKNEHIKKCQEAHFTYRFSPIPGIGINGEIWCEKCGRHFTFCTD